MSSTLLIVLLLILLDFGLASRVHGKSFKGLNDLNESYILVGSEVVLLAGLQTTPLGDGYP